ncbi:MAG TPA: hypothetical protein VFA56_05615 [Gaiellaceae bacterium]|nr:hypothetical protein [Gaiellaceae bacterium]
MATATEERLGAMKRRIDHLEQTARTRAAGVTSWLEQYLDNLKHDEASAREAANREAGAVDEKLEQLRNDLDLAEHRLEAEIAADRQHFTDAVDAELHDWDVFLERMQAKAATLSGAERARAEAAIAVARHLRTDVADAVAAMRSAADERWNDAKVRVLQSLDDLKRKADALRKD